MKFGHELSALKFRILLVATMLAPQSSFGCDWVVKVTTAATGEVRKFIPLEQSKSRWIDIFYADSVPYAQCMFSKFDDTDKLTTREREVVRSNTGVLALCSYIGTENMFSTGARDVSMHDKRASTSGTTHMQLYGTGGVVLSEISIMCSSR